MQRIEIREDRDVVYSARSVRDDEKAVMTVLNAAVRNYLPNEQNSTKGREILKSAEDSQGDFNTQNSVCLA